MQLGPAVVGQPSRWNPRLLAAGTGVIVLYLLITVVFGGNAYYMQVLQLAAINVSMAVSLNLINGVTGLFSIGHAGFMAVGAYVSAALTVFLRVPFPLALCAGGIAACLVGFVVGVPTLRLGGDYLAIATLGFGEIIRVVVVNIDQVGGPRGFTGIPPHTTFLWAYVAAVVCVVAVSNFVNSTHGRACKAIREDEVAAELMGINLVKYKVSAFVIASFFAGVGGGLLVHTLMLAHPNMFSVLRSVDYLIMIVVGGYGSITGAVAAASGFTVLMETLRFIQDWRMIVYGLILVLVMLTKPEGLLGGRELTLDSLARFASRVIRTGWSVRRAGRGGTAGGSANH